MDKNVNIKRKSTSSFGLLEMAILVVMTLLISLGIGYYFGTRDKQNTKEKEDPYVQKFLDNYQYISENYYKKINKSDLIDQAIKGMVESLGDDYSNFMDEAESNTFDVTLDGAYEGLGVTIVQDQDGKINVIKVMDDSPASSAGVKVLDIIKTINGKSVEGMTAVEVTDFIKKEKGKNFTLEISREGKNIKLELKKENIVLKSVSSKLMEKEGKKIGYVQIDIFALNTYEQFKKALQNLEKEGMQSLIIDVRDNGGGHLSAAKQMLSELLDSSKVIYQTEVKGKKTKEYSTGKETKKYPIVFLTNDGTASGSEVLVAALKDNLGSISIGTTTFGKGTVQELVGLSTGSQYKVTVKKWLTPKGNWVNEKGIKPDIECVLSEEYTKNPSDETDNQLQKAIEYLKSK